MKIKQLIKELEKYDPNLDVVLYDDTADECNGLDSVEEDDFSWEDKCVILFPK